ncbi:MAG TPA: malto-oligosyltrehalose synthase [Candidatus Limnocylindria bacterium]
MTAPASAIPRATYRVQLHAGFTFDDAARIVPYLAELGISHLYTSPILQAAPGSTHGYDVIDHARVSDELGGEEGFLRLSDTLRDSGMGLVVDIVPNHMAIAEGNRWWWDLLANGPASRWARHFDVDWDPPEARLRNVILLPVLPDHYGRVLEAGEIGLARRGATVVVETVGRAFPLDPRTTAPIVADAGARLASDEMLFLAEALESLPPSTAEDRILVERRQRDVEVVAARLSELIAEPGVAAAVDAAIGERTADVDALDALLEAQHYRLAFWRAGSRDLGYRRFFDIDELVGIRVEDEDVFADTHARVLAWVREGRVDGLRIDHPDGLRDPGGYVARLRASAPEAWIVAEKILGADEPLRTDWPLDGTTGYEFANRAVGLLVDPAARDALDAAWAGAADVGPAWDEIAGDARLTALSELLGSDLNRLADLVLAVCEANRRHRDYTRHELHHALRETAAALGIYRTYVRPGDPLNDADRAAIDAAVRVAAERRPDLDRELFAFLGRILRLEEPGTFATELAMRFQQLTPAAMAKGIEDTAFYRYHRLTALNEVGGDPGRFGADPSHVHAALAQTAERWPAGMLALSTHDTKRSADVRARLAVLAEDPATWRSAMATLGALERPHRSGDAPTDADAYLGLQAIVGAWPIDADRLAAYLAKATHEAKLRTSWTAPDAGYDAGVDGWARSILADPAFVAAVDATVAGVGDAARVASLVQVALQLTAPGVPDCYQGGELWELSLVDPDNRRPVDYDVRRRLLAAAIAMGGAEAWAAREDGLPKQWLIHRALALRSRRPEAFVGSYAPLALDGPRAGAGFAFLRGDAVATVVPRHAVRIGRDGWAGTGVTLPEGRWRDLDGAPWSGRVALDELLASFPVAILERQA